MAENRGSRGKVVVFIESDDLTRDDLHYLLRAFEPRPLRDYLKAYWFANAHSMGNRRGSSKRPDLKLFLHQVGTNHKDKELEK